jgi:hypothetical protein
MCHDAASLDRAADTVGKTNSTMKDSRKQRDRRVRDRDRSARHENCGWSETLRRGGGG